MGFGIGGDEQNVDVAGTYPTLNTDYPGQNIYDDATSVVYLERPVKLSGTAGVGSASGTWLRNVVAPPDLSGVTTVDFEVFFAAADLHLGGAYPAVPLSEVALMLSTEEAVRTSAEVYDYGTGPDFINTSTRQKLVAYNAFATLTKTAAVSLELHWQIQF